MVFVIDASIICKWALAGDDEPDQDAAMEILSRWLHEIDRIILPPLWLFEVGNVIGLKRPAHARSLIALLLDYEFEEAQITKEICTLSLDLMHDLKVTFYDAVYHAVAIDHNATFITADKRYFDKAVDKSNIQLLGA